MLKRVLKKWNQYKYRFVPWLAVNINESSPRVVPSVSQDKVTEDQIVESILIKLFTKFHQNHQQFKFHKHQVSESDGSYVSNMQAMAAVLGFTIERQNSSLRDGGRGVFVTGGHVKQGSIVAMYPGVIYQPWEPVFLVSLGNSFLFRCADGLHIDGKDTGLSRMMYNSSSKRDSVWGEFTCDTTWLGERPLNPLGVGQYVNNQTHEYPANVTYQEFDVPADFPAELRKYIPNIEARLHHDMEHNLHDRLLRVIVLVAVRDICVGEELFSTYYTIVQSKPGVNR